MPAPDASSTNKVVMQNRIGILLAHSKRYAFRSQSRLASDTRLSEATMSRVLRGKQSPSFSTAVRITEQLEKAFGCRIDPRDVLSVSGAYLTGDACTMAGCRGCALTGKKEYETTAARKCLITALVKVTAG